MRLQKSWNLRATIIMQGRGKVSRKLSKAIQSIASDNRTMFEFFINAFTRIINLVFSAVKAIGEWIPFTWFNKDTSKVKQDYEIDKPFNLYKC